MEVSDKEVKSRWVWREGRTYLESRGCQEKNAANIIGRWVKTYKISDVYEAITAAIDNDPARPVEYIGKILGQRTATGAIPLESLTNTELTAKIRFWRKQVAFNGLGKHGLDDMEAAARARKISV